MNYSSDLPSEHGVSDRAPVERKVFAGQHQRPSNLPAKYAITPPLNGRTFSFFAGSDPSASRVLGMNQKRRGLTIVNSSLKTVYVSVSTQAGFDGTQVINAIPVEAGFGYEFPAFAAPVNDVFIVTTTGTAHVIITEYIIGDTST